MTEQLAQATTIDYRPDAVGVGVPPIGLDVPVATVKTSLDSNVSSVEPSSLGLMATLKPTSSRLAVSEESQQRRTPQPDVPVPRTRYELRGELGRGGMGVVLRAFDPEIGREVAMKLLPVDKTTPRGVSRFLQEAQITGQLEHPSIIPVHEVKRDAEGQLFFTMKLMRGQSLRATIESVRAAIKAGRMLRWTLLERLDLFRKICDAIAFAHSKTVIHRDLKPENVMLGEFGELQVMDWGLARVIGQPEDNAAVGVTVVADEAEGALRTQDGYIAGTPAYMPPEQARGEISKLDQRSDVYSLGAILYELLAFSPPFRGKTALDVLKQVRKGELMPPRARAKADFGAQAPEIPTELQAVVLKAMAFEQSRRYPDVVALRAEIDAFLSNEPVRFYRYTWLEKVSKAARRRPLLALSMTLSLMFVCVIGVIVATASAWISQAETQAAQAKAEKAQLEIAKAHEAAERERLKQEADLREMVQRNEIGKLRERYGIRVKFERDALLREFDERMKLGHANGKPEEQAIQELTDEYAAQVIKAEEEAIRASTEFGERFHDSTDCHRLALLYALKKRDLIKAEHYADLAVKEDPKSTAALVVRGVIRRMREKFQEAVADFSAAIRLNNTDYRAFVSRGICYSLLNNPGAAINDFTQALELAPVPEVYCNRGMVYLGLNNLAAAQADFLEALNLRPNFPGGHYGLARVYDMNGDTQRCRQHLDLAIQAYPKYFEALQYRGRLFQALGDDRSALADFNAALDVRPNDALTRYGRGLSRANLNNLSGAELDLREAARLMPNFAGVWEQLGLVQERSNNVPQAITSLQRAYQAATTPAERQRIATALQRLGGEVPR